MIRGVGGEGWKLFFLRGIEVGVEIDRIVFGGKEGGREGEGRGV